MLKYRKENMEVFNEKSYILFGRHIGFRCFSNYLNDCIGKYKNTGADYYRFEFISVSGMYNKIV